MSFIEDWVSGIENFVSGKIPLVKTFWIYGVLVDALAFFCAVISGFVFLYFYETLPLPVLKVFYYVGNIIIIAAVCVILVAVWKSSTNYTGGGKWVYLARLLAVLGGMCTVAVVLFYLLFGSILLDI